MTDILIAGAGCAGLTAAIYAARAGKSVLVLEAESMGGQIASSPRVENYPGIPSISGLDFADRLFAQAEALGVEFDFARVTGLRPGSPMTVLTDAGERTCKSVILAVGARHRALGLAREQELAGKGVGYCAVCDGAFYKGRAAAVVGGGSAALQSAEYLASVCSEVTLIHRRDTFRGEAALARRVAALPNVRLALDTVVAALEGETALTGLVLENKKTGARTRLAVPALFIAAGQTPDTDALRGLVALDEAGYIAAGEDCRTSLPGVFAAGDCRTKAVRQLTTAAADGAVAALAACSWAG
jgi:thioredoxin reductase (NADPH)